MSDTITTVNRRAILSLAAGCAVVSSGCPMLKAPQEDSGTAAPKTELKRTPVDPEETGQATRRLFTISLQETSPQDEVAIQAQCQDLSDQARQTGDVLKSWGRPVAGSAVHLTGWLTPVTVAAFQKLKTVRQVEAHKPGAPVQSTFTTFRQQLTDSPPEGKRNLIVILGPNSWPNCPDLKGLQTSEKIAELWNEALRATESVSISAIKAAQWSDINGANVHIGPVPGQIRVTVEGLAVPDKVLKTIQSHPQVERLQWDHAEFIYNCPPCGRG